MIPKASCIKPKMGERLKEWRKGQGLTLNDLSAMIDGTPGPLSEGHLSKLIFRSVFYQNGIFV